MNAALLIPATTIDPDHINYRPILIVHSPSRDAAQVAEIYLLQRENHVFTHHTRVESNVSSAFDTWYIVCHSERGITQEQDDQNQIYGVWA